ncbi:MAG: mercuric reductase [Rhodopirellula sp. TMED11]|nr:MAG: mercuric reductase [Rhodopirellula sp. TMED11]
MNALLPNNEFDQQLIANVHPADWKNPQPAGPYHLVIIGAGTAGLVTAAGAAGLGAKVALIERSLMGGDCLNVGCVPSKGLIAAARAVWGARQASPFFADTIEFGEVNFSAAMDRMRRLRAGISPHDSAARFRELGVDVYLGEAQFVDRQNVDVGGTTLAFKRAVIASGARASAPPINGLAGTPYLTNETLFNLTERPERLGIVGAGPIGVEMAQTFARLGSQVCLIETKQNLLPREDRDAADIVSRQLLKDGVDVLCGGRDLEVHYDGSFRLRLNCQDHQEERQVDQLLVAVGRAPNLESLQLENAGVRFDKKGVIVNDYLQTSNPKVFAAGDVCSRFQFTHAADFMARIVIQNALFALGPFGRKKFSQLTIPWATYCSPELARVGINEQEAQASGIEIDTYTVKLSEVDRAILEGLGDGFVKIHTQAGKDKIVGATIVAPNAGDLISEVALAMTNKIGLGSIASTIHPYPTLADAIRKAGDQFNRTRLTSTSKKLLNLLRRINVGF